LGEEVAQAVRSAVVAIGVATGLSWSTQVVVSDTTVGDQLQIALDSSGAPHFSYQSKSILAEINPAAGELWHVATGLTGSPFQRNHRSPGTTLLA
jgi:hypothetical protein